MSAELIPETTANRRQFLRLVSSAAAITALGACSSTEKPAGRTETVNNAPGGQGGGEAITAIGPKFHKVIDGLTRGQHPGLAQKINAAIGLSPATNCDSRNIILPKSGGNIATNLAAARFTAVDYSRAAPGRELNVSISPDIKYPDFKRSDFLLTPFRERGINPQTIRDLPGYSIYYDPNTQPGYSNPGRLTIIQDGQPVGGNIIDITLTEFGHTAKQHTEVAGGYHLALAAAVELHKAVLR